MSAGIDSMFAVLLVPLGDGRGLVHVLDDLPPADSGGVRAEGNFTQLRRIRNDAHLGASEVIVEQILEPHSSNEQEVPGIVAALLNVYHRSVAGNLSITL